MVHKLFSFNVSDKFLETSLSNRRSLARKWHFFKYLWQYLNPLSSSGVDMFLIGTALMKLLSVSNITNSSNQVLDFFVKCGVDDVNGDMTCLAGR